VDDCRVQVDHPPPSYIALQGGAVVYLARIRHNYVAGCGADGPNATPRALRAKSYDPDAELIVRMTREIVVGDERHRLNSPHGQFVLLHLMNSRRHCGQRSLRAAIGSTIL
jgi:hypothetical protein